MTVGGLVLAPADIIMKGLSDAMIEHGDRKWIQDNDLYTFFDWLELLPVSDQPFALFVGLDAMAAKFEFGKWRVRDLLNSVRHLEEGLRVELLRGLVPDTRSRPTSTSWFLRSRSRARQRWTSYWKSRPGKYGNKPIERVARFDYPDELFLTLSPRRRESLPARYEGATDERQKALLAGILLAGADHATFQSLH